MKTDGWKQNIPLDLFRFFGDDHRARLVYTELLLMAAFNDDKTERKGEEPMRGECYFSIKSLAKKFAWGKSTMQKVLRRISSPESIRLAYGECTLIKITTTSKCSICKLLNYDEIVGSKSKVYAQYTGSGTESQLSININNTSLKEGVTVSTLTESEPEKEKVPEKRKTSVTLEHQIRRREFHKQLLARLSRPKFKEDGGVLNGQLDLLLKLKDLIGDELFERNLMTLKDNPWHNTQRNTMGSVTAIYREMSTMEAPGILDKSATKERKPLVIEPRN